MEGLLTVLFIIISFLLITIVLLQSSKAEGASQAFMGGTSDLFAERKERGAQVVIVRITYVLGFTFCALAVILSVII